MKKVSTKTMSTALRFVLLIGVMSFFADFTYEGARSIIGPYLGALGAGAFVISSVTGFGELLGYGLRLVSGRLSDRFQRFWPVAIFGYIVQMASVPLLALAGSWQIAAALILLERIGKATRNPPRDVMLSHAAKEMGYGWGFGIHEALDQFGALFGPLIVAAVLAWRGMYQLAFAVLLIPALITLSILAAARLLYPQPEKLEYAVNSREETIGGCTTIRGNHWRYRSRYNRLMNTDTQSPQGYTDQGNPKIAQENERRKKRGEQRQWDQHNQTSAFAVSSA